MAGSCKIPGMAPGAGPLQPIARDTPITMGFTEFVAFVSACMALNALAIDFMLPALPVMNRDFALGDPNAAQAVILAYVLGMGASQLFYGPLADRYGRRPVLIGGLILFAVAGAFTVVSTGFSTFLAARTVQGLGAGAPRIIAVTLVRDRYAGLQMGRVMSLALMILMMVPILAPALGQLILLVTTWRWAFAIMVLLDGVLLAWALLRLEETLPRERRRPVSPGAIARAYRQVLSTRISVGYMLCLGIVMGAHMGFVTSAAQIFTDVFQAGARFPLLFALVALCMSVAAFVNSRLVHRLGMQRIVQGGLAVLVATNAVHLGTLWADGESLAVFMALQAVNMFVFGLLAANLTALALDPLGEIAGTASSMVGLFMTWLGGLIGFAIGQCFDGTVTPLVGAYLALGLLALGLVVATERKGAAAGAG